VTFHFAEKNVLVTHLCSPRSVQVHWLNRLPLLGKDSREWREAVAESKRRWENLFPEHDPHKGESIDDFLSNATIG
jgi:hypothetical protein